MNKWLLLPDIHIPKHDKRKLSTVLRIAQDWKPDYITILGDLDDMEGPSYWADGTVEEVTEGLAKSAPLVRKFLEDLRAVHTDAEIFYRMGNHEQRFYDYIGKRAKALVGTIDLPKLYDLENLGVKYAMHKEIPTKLYNGIYVTHGTKINSEAGATAKAEYEKYGVSGFSAHTHRLGSYRKTTMRGTEWWYECGHLCDPAQMHYDPFSNWQAGFAYAYLDGKQTFPFLAEFGGNKVVFDGVLYKG